MVAAQIYLSHAGLAECETCLQKEELVLAGAFGSLLTATEAAFERPVWAGFVSFLFPVAVRHRNLALWGTISIPCLTSRGCLDDQPW